MEEPAVPGERGGAGRGRSGGLGICSAPLSRFGGGVGGFDYFIAGNGMQRQIALVRRHTWGRQELGGRIVGGAKAAPSNTKMWRSGTSSSSVRRRGYPAILNSCDEGSPAFGIFQGIR